VIVSEFIDDEADDDDDDSHISKATYGHKFSKLFVFNTTQ